MDVDVSVRDPISFARVFLTLWVFLSDLLRGVSWFESVGWASFPANQTLKLFNPISSARVSLTLWDFH